MEQVIRERHISRQVGARVERAGPLPAVEGRHKGMLVDPVGACGGTGEAFADAVAGGVDAVFGVQVDFSDDARHVDALEVAHAAGLALWDGEGGELVGGDFVLADGAFTAVVCE